MNDIFTNNIQYQFINYFKTGNLIIDTMVITILISFIGFLSKQFDKIIYSDILSFFSAEHIKNWFYKTNTVEYEGKITVITNTYDTIFSVIPTFSNRFKALWDLIIKRSEVNKEIYKIREYNFTSLRGQKNEPVYIVNQQTRFLLDKELGIYAYTNNFFEDNSDSNESKAPKSKVEIIKIYLYSNKSSITQIKNFVEEITNNYLKTIEIHRENKLFVYTLIKSIIDEDYEYDAWNETQFESSRSFNNLFFEQKEHSLQKINFFLNNRDWYFKKGIPYSLGIGLYGKPGTGKTSFIKALANYTKRHIIVISLKLIKTKTELEECFFENIYNDDNEKSPIDFSKKIIVFEDIDCIGDIVLNRDKKHKKEKFLSDEESDDEYDKSNNATKLVEALVTANLSDTEKGSLIKTSSVTLDDILNLWDGIRETPGRIMIITSNHYDKLDPALVRPGRIDLTLEMTNVTHNIIREVYEKWFGSQIDEHILSQIEDNFYSPAELINIYVSSNNDPAKFLDRLLLNTHV
jgi:hypothetical protein